MIIGNGGQNPRFLQAGLFDQGDVLLGRPDPAGDLRVAESKVLASGDAFLILPAVEKKFRLADDPVLSAQPVHQRIEVDDLLDGVRRPSLLPIPEGRIGNENFFGRLNGNNPMVEVDPADLFIGKDFLLQIRFVHIPQLEAPEPGMLVIQDSFFGIPFCHVLNSKS